MGYVHNLDDHRPHLTMQTSDGAIHVIPAALFDAVVSGDQAVSALSDQIVRAIVAEWLGFVRGKE